MPPRGDRRLCQSVLEGILVAAAAAAAPGDRICRANARRIPVDDGGREADVHVHAAAHTARKGKAVAPAHCIDGNTSHHRRLQIAPSAAPKVTSSPANAVHM